MSSGNSQRILGTVSESSKISADNIQARASSWSHPWVCCTLCHIVHGAPWWERADERWLPQRWRRSTGTPPNTAQAVQLPVGGIHMYNLAIFAVVEFCITAFWNIKIIT